jgi:hypothetical protein
VHLQYTKSQRAICPIEGSNGLPRVTSTILLRDLPYLLDQKRPVREYEVVGEECTETSPIYRLTSENIRFLTDEEVKKKEREAKMRERSATGLCMMVWGCG